MKTSFKTALAALALTAGATAAIPANAQSFGLSFGPQGGISFSYDSGGYCDSYGCPDDFWDMPVYYGPVFWHGHWYDGPVYYRSFFGHRQYWIAGDWRDDEWRGPHPGWWREGRYGPPLGVDFYRSHGFHGRWDRGGDRGHDRHDRRDNGPGFNPRDDRGGDRGGFDRPDNRGSGNFDRRDDRGPMDQRGGSRPGPQPQQGRDPQAAPQGAPRVGPNPPAPGFQPRADGRGYGHYDRPAPGAAPAAAPAAAPPAPAATPAAPATPPAGGHDDHQHRDNH